MALPAEALDALRAVVLDFDGTLADTRIDFGLMRSRTRRLIQAWDLWEDRLEDGRFVLEMIRYAADKLPGGRLREQFEAEAAQMLIDVEMLSCETAAPFPGAAEALDALSARGFRLGIVTRNCRTAVSCVLARHHLRHDALLTRDDVERVKPEKEHLLEALALLGVGPREAIMVGDHRTDIECGRAAGTWTCGVLTDKTTEAEHLAAGAHMVVATVPDLARLLCDGSGEVRR